MTIWPESLTSSGEESRNGFAWFPDDFESIFKELADLAEKEDWDYHYTSTPFKRPVLFNYIKYTYKRLCEESKIVVSDDGRWSCFNTGLVTENQEPIYASFEINRNPDSEPWVFKCWLRRGDFKLNVFPELPDIAHYFMTTQLVLYLMREKILG